MNNSLSNKVYRKNVLLLIFEYCVSFFTSLYLCKIPSFLFRDRDSYYNDYAAGYQIVLDNIKNPIQYLFNEPLFLYLNKLLAFFNEPNLTIEIIVFFIVFITLLSVFKLFDNPFKGLFFFIFICFNVQFFALMLVTLRQGLGFAILLMSIFYIKDFKKIASIALLLGLVHNSYYVVSIFFFLYYYLEKRFSFKKAVLYLFVIGLIFNSFVLLLTKLVGSKQTYDNFNDKGSGILFFFWGICFLYILWFKTNEFKKASVLEKNIFCIAIIGLIIYLSSYFLSPIAGRIIGTFIPFIFYVLIFRINLRDIVFVFVFLILNLFILVNGGADNFLNYKLDEFIYFIQYNY